MRLKYLLCKRVILDVFEQNISIAFYRNGIQVACSSMTDLKMTRRTPGRMPTGTDNHIAYEITWDNVDKSLLDHLHVVCHAN